VQEVVDSFEEQLLTEKYANLQELMQRKGKLSKEEKTAKDTLCKELNKEVSAHRRSLSEALEQEHYYCRILFMKHLHADRRADGDRMRAFDASSSESLQKLAKDTKKAFWNSCKADLLLR
jgi:hypothetical protein